MSYHADKSLGKCQLIYILYDDIRESHEEFATKWEEEGVELSRLDVTKLPEFKPGLPDSERAVGFEHGTSFASNAGGWRLEMARQAQLIIVRDCTSTPADANNRIIDLHLRSGLCL